MIKTVFAFVLIDTLMPQTGLGHDVIAKQLVTSTYVICKKHDTGPCARRVIGGTSALLLAPQ